MKKKSIIIGLLLITIVLGITYAWWNWNSSNNTNVSFTIEGATITYNAGPDISNIKLIPVSSKEKGVTDNTAVYKEITASANKTMYINLNLDLVTFPSNLADQSLVWEIYKGTTKIGNGNFSNKAQGDSITLFENQEINGTESLYKLYIWIDGNQENSSTMMNQSFVFHLNADATDEASPQPLDSSGANAPDLVQGLIPVRYDDTNSTWVKADSANTNNDWYNYNEKKWANAVLVRETGYEPHLNQENKTVSIDNIPTIVDKYTSSNQGIASTTSSTKFTFTTGSSTGTISFDYTVSSQSNDKFSATLKKETASVSTIVSARGGTYDTSYSGSLSANSTYVLTVNYVKNASVNSLDDEATISNINITNLSGNITVASSGDYGWTRSDRYIYPLSTYTSYNHYDDGSYILASNNAVKVSAEDSVNNYICSDTTSTTCSTLYKIKSYSGNTITAVDEYNNSSFTARSAYQSASVGTEIKEDAILAYYVWIPRYKYRVFNINKVINTDSYNAQTKGIDILFENNKETTGTIECNYDFTITDESLSEICTGSNGEYYTHPAFTFGNDEVTGFWVGKFEISSENPSASNSGGYSTALTVRVKPNIPSWTNNTVTNFYKVIYDMQINNNIYGLSTDRTNTDSHMLKNMEWGAIAYLTNSNYGRCSNNTCTEVTINNSYDFITGNAGNSISTSSASGTTNAYNTAKGQLASTTGNIYGIYDMSGGAYEYVMGNMSSATGSYTYYASSGGFNYTYTGYEKYINTYAYGTSNTNQTAYNRSRLGDATGETKGWYSDGAGFVYSSRSWFFRGGNYRGTADAGPFYFYTIGNTNNFNSARSALLSTSA